MRELVLTETATGSESAAPRWDEAAFREFHDATALRLRAYLRRTTGRLEQADDIVQESYLRFLRVPRGTAADPAAFLFRIATNLLYDQWRRARRERSLLDWFRPAPKAADGTLKHDVGRLLDALAPRDRALLWLAYVEGWDHQEIGSILGLGAASVRVMLFRARGRLARSMARAGVGQEVLR